MDDLGSERVVLLGFLLGYQQTIRRLRPEYQLLLWDRVIDLMLSISLAPSEAGMIDEHRKLHELGGSIHALQLRSQAKDRSLQQRSSLPLAGP